MAASGSFVVADSQIMSKHHLSTFKEVTEDEVRQVIMKSACTVDPIPTYILKEHVSSLVPNITKMVNMSISSGTVPPSFKMALVTPSLKKVTLDLNTLKNYRPQTSNNLINWHIALYTAKKQHL